MKQMFKAFIEGELSKLNQKAEKLENGSIFQHGIANVPTFVLSDERLPLSARLVYVACCALADINEPIEELEVIAQWFDIEPDQLVDAIRLLLVLGYLEETSKGLVRTIHPKIEKDLKNNQEEKMGQLLKCLDQIEEKVGRLNQEQAKELLSHLMEATGIKSERVVSNKEEATHPKHAIIKKVSEEVLENIKSETKKVVIEVDFENGMASVEMS